MPYYKMKTGDARAITHNCPISRKLSVELAREIRNKPVKKVEKYLEDIIILKRHVPLKRYFHDVGHKRGPSVSGVKAGRFPVKAAKYFQKLLKMALSNADYAGLDLNKPMFVKGCVVSGGVKKYGYQAKGHRRLRRDETVNIEIVVKQLGKVDIKNKIPVKKAEEKKVEEKKVDEKIVEKKQEEKKQEPEKKIVEEESRQAFKKEMYKEKQIEDKVERKIINRDTEIMRPKKKSDI